MTGRAAKGASSSSICPATSVTTLFTILNSGRAQSATTSIQTPEKAKPTPAQRVGVHAKRSLADFQTKLRCRSRHIASVGVVQRRVRC